MKVLFAIVSLVCAVGCIAGTAGSFAGTIVNGPESSGSWIYVQGHNHSLRKVDVSRAKIRYESGVPRAERQTPAGPGKLRAGTQVRVTAEVDDVGEWHATEVEVLQVSPRNGEKKPLSPTTSQT